MFVTTKGEPFVCSNGTRVRSRFHRNRAHGLALEHDLQFFTARKNCSIRPRAIEVELMAYAKTEPIEVELMAHVHAPGGYFSCLCVGTYMLRGGVFFLFVCCPPARIFVGGPPARIFVQNHFEIVPANFSLSLGRVQRVDDICSTRRYRNRPAPPRPPRSRPRSPLPLEGAVLVLFVRELGASTVLTVRGGRPVRSVGESGRMLQFTRSQRWRKRPDSLLQDRDRSRTDRSRTDSVRTCSGGGIFPVCVLVVGGPPARIFVQNHFEIVPANFDLFGCFGGWGVWGCVWVSETVLWWDRSSGIDKSGRGALSSMISAGAGGPQRRCCTSSISSPCPLFQASRSFAFHCFVGEGISWGSVPQKRTYRTAAPVLLLIHARQHCPGVFL